MSPKLFIATKAFILNSEGRVLILRESGSYADGSNTGRYDLPGGRLNAGERFDEALTREVREETGLAVAIGDPITVNEWRPVVRGEEWQIVGIFFKCSAQDGEVALSGDHDAYEWINPTQYESFPIIGNLRPVFEAYIQRGKGNFGSA